jgi:hypothetical protein
MAYFERVGERGDAAEANAILGAPGLTLDVWLQQQAVGPPPADRAGPTTGARGRLDAAARVNR